MSYQATILADSVTPRGKRLTTIAVTFPRFILAEVNTHRMLSRNSASSRAIPPEKQIEAVVKHPFIPETFNSRVAGMGVGEELADSDQEACRDIWLHARDQAVASAIRLTDIGVDKSRINRILEPFLWHTAILSATEWENFFALRCPVGEEWTPAFGAQPEFQITTIAMRAALRASTPLEIPVGKWHMPLVDEEGRGINSGWWAMVSAGRCARVSYEKHEELESAADSYARAQRLAESGHWSPFEHQAVASERAEQRSGNFIGWLQHRKTFYGEDNAGLNPVEGTRKVTGYSV